MTETHGSCPFVSARASALIRSCRGPAGRRARPRARQRGADGQRARGAPVGAGPAAEPGRVVSRRDIGPDVAARRGAAAAPADAGGRPAAADRHPAPPGLRARRRDDAVRPRPQGASASAPTASWCSRAGARPPASSARRTTTTATIAHPLLSLLPDVLHLPADPVGGAKVAAILALLAGEVGGHEPGSRAGVARLVDLLLIQVVRWWIATGDDGRASWLRALRDPTLAAVLAAVHERPGEPWTVEALAATAHVSRATLARRFAEEVGEPPLAYLTRWRMDARRAPPARRRRAGGDDRARRSATRPSTRSTARSPAIAASHPGATGARPRRPSGRRARRGRRRGSARPGAARACRRSGSGTR